MLLTSILGVLFFSQVADTHEDDNAEDSTTIHNGDQVAFSFSTGSFYTGEVIMIGETEADNTTWIKVEYFSQFLNSNCATWIKSTSVLFLGRSEAA